MKIMNNVIYEMFEDKIRENPSASAVYDGNRFLTRKGLDALADTIALQIPAGTKRVGIVMNHGVEMIAAIFAVLKSGAAYVPAEPFFPDDRIRFMFCESEPGTACRQYPFMKSAVSVRHQGSGTFSRTIMIILYSRPGNN